MTLPTPPQPTPKPVPVGQPVSPVDFFKRAPGGGTAYVKQVPALTSRELQIASLASKGMTNTRIAQRLSLTVSTVEQYLTRAYRKLGCRRPGLVAALSEPNTQEHTHG